jgi:hypothetical protein
LLLDFTEGNAGRGEEGFNIVVELLLLLFVVGNIIVGLPALRPSKGEPKYFVLCYPLVAI